MSKNHERPVAATVMTVELDARKPGRNIIRFGLDQRGEGDSRVQVHTKSHPVSAKARNMERARLKSRRRILR